MEKKKKVKFDDMMEKMKITKNPDLKRKNVVVVGLSENKYNATEMPKRCKDCGGKVYADIDKKDATAFLCHNCFMNNDDYVKKSLVEMSEKDVTKAFENMLKREINRDEAIAG